MCHYNFATTELTFRSLVDVVCSSVAAATSSLLLLRPPPNLLQSSLLPPQIHLSPLLCPASSLLFVTTHCLSPLLLSSSAASARVTFSPLKPASMISPTLGQSRPSQFHQPTCFWKWVGGTNPFKSGILSSEADPEKNIHCSCQVGHIIGTCGA